MLELPEASTIANQINHTMKGKRITDVIVAHTPHKLAWYYGDPRQYRDRLNGKIIDRANGVGGMVEIKAGNSIILFGDGVGLRFHEANEQRPPKHQLLIEFDDTTALSASVQMYGGLGCFQAGEGDNPYYIVAKEKPSPLSAEFDKAYFSRMITLPEAQKLSAKAFLATEQRIPGLGNGVLQDILFNAKIHPKQKIKNLSHRDQDILYDSIKTTIAAMTSGGGRDTERDLFGAPGQYQTKLCKNTVGQPCPVCNGVIKKENYLGGSIYYCDGCQRISG